MDESDVFSFAVECARIYCARFKCWEQLDDATQEAALWLLRNRGKWNLRKSSLKNAVVFALIRWYQNENHLRRKNPPERVEFPLEGIATDSTNELEAREILDAAIVNAGVEKYRSVVWACVHGEKMKNVAKEYGLSIWRVQWILERTRREFLELVNG